MIQIDSLKKTYGGQLLFDGASFTLQKKEKCGLVGRNGSGKSTLLKMVVGLEHEDGGQISIPNNYLIGYLEQHIHFSQPTILDEAALGLKESEKTHLYKVEKILFGLGFTEDDLYQSPDVLSGGYHLRLHLAKVLVSDPDCLLLDEPTNYLDIVSIRWMTKFLQEWPREFIIITHDREFMDAVCNTVVGIHRQKIKKVKGKTADYFGQLLLEEEIYEKTRQNMEKKKQHLEKFITRFGAKASKATQAQSKLKALHKLPSLEKLAALYHLDFSFNEAPFPGKKMTEIDNITFGYDEPLIRNFSMTLGKEERVAIIGKNGRGKTTLMRLIAGELQPQEGSVKISENARPGIFGQTHIERLKPTQTIEQEIGNANSSLNTTEVRGVCGLMMFDGDLAKKTISVLSGGERSRVQLGKIIATPNNILFLDEPTHHLDMESIEALIQAINSFDGAVVIVTHTELILNSLPLTQVVLCTEKTQQVFLGNYQEFLDRGGWESDQPQRKEPKKKDSGKQDRAALIQKRSQELKGPKQRMEKIEAELKQLEMEFGKNEQLLIDASLNGKTLQIQTLSKSIAEQKEKIDSLYATYTQTSDEYSSIEKRYATLIGKDD